MTEWQWANHELPKTYNRTLHETPRQNRLYYTKVAVGNLTETSLTIYGERVGNS